MFVSGFLILLYFLAYFYGPGAVGLGLLISSNSVILSGVAFILSAVSYLWAPKKFMISMSLAIYALLAATTANLIVSSTGLSSPFIALWILVGVFAGIFGLYGLIPMFIASSAYLFLEFMNRSIGQNTVIITIIAGYLPLIASFIIWHSKRSRQNSEGKAYSDLANELSQVAVKSEVVINAIADGVIAIDAQGIIQLINPAAQQIIGWGKQDAMKLNYKSVLKLSDTNGKELVAASDPIQEALATNQDVRKNNLSLETNSGKKLLISSVVSPAGQAGAGVIIVFRDITKEKAEEREMAEFISTASHEMRTPVASIEGYLGLVLNPSVVRIDEKTRDFVTKAHESAQHLGRLFQDLLDVSKAEDGRLSNNPKVVDVIHFTHTVVESLRTQAEAKNLSLMFKPQSNDANLNDRHLSPVFYAQVDNDHLREVITNLTENAIKYTPKGTVVIDVTGDNEKIVISVSDSGIGIPTEDISHLFQKFYRVDNTDTREIGGTGLGLYLCRRLAEVMSGRIWVESKYKQGSTFFFEIPRVSHEDATRLIEDTIGPITPITEPQPQQAPVVVVQTPVQPNLSDTITSPSASQVAEQLKRINPPQAQQIPLPVNTPLTSIEQNPAQYTQARPPSVSIPVRTPNQSN